MQTEAGLAPKKRNTFPTSKLTSQKPQTPATAHVDAKYLASITSIGQPGWN